MTAPVIPQTGDELAEFIVDRKRMSEVFNAEDPTVLPSFLTAYARATNKADAGIERKRIDDAAQQRRGGGRSGAGSRQATAAATWPKAPTCCISRTPTAMAWPKPARCCCAT